MARYNYDFSEELHRAVKQYALDNDMTLQQVITLALQLLCQKGE